MPILLACISGLLLFVSDQPLLWWPLQAIALVPFCVALQEAQRSHWRLGLAFATGYALPLLLVAGTTLPILVVLAITLLQWPLLAPILARCLAAGPVRGAFAAAAAVTLLEAVIWHGLPLFGTGTAFVRPLGHAGALTGLAAYTGPSGLVFAVVAGNALLASCGRPGARRPACLALLGLLAAVAVPALLRQQRPLGPTVRVAAFGWNDTPAVPGQAQELPAILHQRAGEAAAAGAQLLVTPETGFTVYRNQREASLTMLGELAKTHRMALAIGVWHDPTRDNRIWFFAADGSLLGEYRKTHLVPFMEEYVVGDGSLVQVDFADHKLGGMICQDDNFLDLARGYGNASTHLLAVPTNDWPEIRGFHLENSLLRVAEQGYAVVRAASGGISALVSPRGKIVAAADHIETGPQLLVGDLPLGDGLPTLYARFGDLPMLLLALLLLVLGYKNRSPSPQ